MFTQCRQEVDCENSDGNVRSPRRVLTPGEWGCATQSIKVRKKDRWTDARPLHYANRSTRPT